MAKSKKKKLKLNITVREEQRNKPEQMAAIEKRSVSNLIEVTADERWERLAEQQGIAYAKTVAEAMNLKVNMDNPSDRERLAPSNSRPCRREKRAKAKTALSRFRMLVLIDQDSITTRRDIGRAVMRRAAIINFVVAARRAKAAESVHG